MYCSYCGTPCEVKWSFCTHCGKALQKKCRICGRFYTGSSCTNCWHEFPEKTYMPMPPIEIPTIFAGGRYDPERESKIASIFTKKWSDIAMKEFIVLDIETTGLSCYLDRIVEICAIRYVNAELVDKFLTLIKPDCKIPFEATQVHKITDQMVRNSPSLRDVMPTLLDFLGSSLIVGHRANFDISFIEVWAKRMGYDPKWRYVDTISIAKKLLPELPNYKQQTILDAIGYKQQHYHRAEADCYGCAEIMLLGLNSVVGTYEEKELSSI